MSVPIARGVLFVHSVPRALCARVEWATGDVLRAPLALLWSDQQAQPGTYRAEIPWEGDVGCGAQLTTALAQLMQIRFEVTEDASRGTDGSRWSFTPSLGIFHAHTDVHGNLLIPEDRIRNVLDAQPADLRGELDHVIGADWDDELEEFRYAGDSAPVRYLHRVG